MRANTERKVPKKKKKKLGQEREREDLSAWVVRGRWRGGRLGGGGGGGGDVIISHRDKKLSIFLSFSAGHHDRRFVIAHHKRSDVVFSFLFFSFFDLFIFIYYVVEIYRFEFKLLHRKEPNQSVSPIDRERDK